MVSDFCANELLEKEILIFFFQLGNVKGLVGIDLCKYIANNAFYANACVF